MPLYEYSCEKCSRKIELLVRGDEKPECPHCHSTKLTKPGLSGEREELSGHDQDAARDRGARGVGGG